MRRVNRVGLMMEMPKPNWTPSFFEDVDTIIDRMKFYTDHKRAFAVFGFGSVVASDTSCPRPDEDYIATLKAVSMQSRDFKVVAMQDGNWITRFAGPVVGIVMAEFFAAHEREIYGGVIEGGLMPGEVLMTSPDASRQLKDYYVGLYARAKLYRDICNPDIIRHFAP